MQSRGMRWVKNLLYGFNLLFVDAGLALIVGGGLILGAVKCGLLGGQMTEPAIALIVVGSIILIPAFLGYCGAKKEHYCMLISFACILIIFFIALLFVGVTAAVYTDSFNTELKKHLKDSLTKYDESVIIHKAWDEVQKRFKCCGLDSPYDWDRGWRIPASCCSKTVGQPCGISQVFHKKGCYNKLVTFFENNFIKVAAVGCGIASIELVGAIMACFLAVKIRREYKMI